MGEEWRKELELRKQSLKRVKRGVKVREGVEGWGRKERVSLKRG